MRSPDSKISLYDLLLTILREQFSAMQAQIEGILADLDSEPLHDFRVASRRSRAALSQMKPAFSTDAAAELIAEYRVLAGITNRLRDLDVFVERFDDLRAQLPLALRENASDYFRRVRRRRKTEAAKVQAFFHSDDFRGRITRLSHMLNGELTIKKGEQADTDAAPFVSEAIRLQYEKVTGSGRIILEKWLDPGTRSPEGDSPDSALHRIRIQCKKLRYMIEFSQRLLSNDTSAVLIEHMKDLQDALGEFNDLSVQTGIVERDTGRCHSTEEIVILGALQALLFVQKNNHFISFRSLFEIFSGRRIAVRFQKVFE